jgi:hypothetical protein
LAYNLFVHFGVRRFTRAPIISAFRRTRAGMPPYKAESTVLV